MILRRSVNGVLGQLANEGLLTDAQLEAARTAAGATSASGTPWFVRVLVGFGAWVASILLFIFLALLRIFDSAAAMVVLGVLLYGGAVAVRRMWRGDFAVQLSLAAGLAGGAMLVFGVTDAFDHRPAAVLVVSLLVALATVPAFPDLVMRFLATATACLTLVLLFHELELGPDAAVAVIGVAAGLVWHFEPWLLAAPSARALQRPVAWALLCSFLFAMLTSVVEERNFLRVGPGASVAASVCLAVVVLAIAGEQRAKLPSEPAMVALAVVALLGAVMFTTPGVPAALYAMLLAFHRRSPVMLGLATLFLVTFGVVFYFRMDLSLLTRGLVLVGSGLLLLVVREYVRRRFGPIVVEELP